MLFNSLDFAIFFSTFFLFYWFILNKNLEIQNIFILISSYIFYAYWDYRFLSLIIISSSIDFLLGLKIFNSKSKMQKKNWLYVSLITNLGLLSIFKYYNFFAESFSNLTNLFGWQPNDLTLNIILPVGISFYTFQTLSYTIDIYRKQFQPTKDIISFFTYVSFFPQLVAGPIERASNLLPQIERKRVFKKKLFNEGVLQILIGLFRKIVIADTLGVYVDTIYGGIGLHNSTSIILATFLYSFQIYYDFAGYSDIAIGLAKLLGFKFNQNFNLPYFSRSITEFWRKWHISLSFWLRDYLYISLGGNRRGIKITYRNLMLTMLLGGLWHGASWNFIIWGAIHGVALSVEKYFNSKIKINKILFLGYPLTFSIVLFSWIFFRSQDLDSAFLAINSILQFDFSMPLLENKSLAINIIFVLSTGLFFDFYLFKQKISLENLGSKFGKFKFIAIVSLIITSINLFYSTSNNFIYFQF